MRVRAVQGATLVDGPTAAHLGKRVGELMTELMRANDLSADDVITLVLTATDDVTPGCPAYVLEELGLGEVPLLWARDPGAGGGVVRVLAHVETHLLRGQLTDVYLHGVSRPDEGAR